MTAKALFLGFDGADHAYMDAMMVEGDLPALASLKKQSRVFNFENDPAMGAAQFWNSALIGAGPGHHGHYFYMQFKPETYDVLPNHESSIPNVTPFWNTLDDEGRKVGVIDWHRLQAKPMKNGFVVDNWMGHDPLTHSIFLPDAITAEARKYFSGDAAAGGFACRKRETADELNAYLEALMKRIDIKTDFCVDKIGQDEWDLFIACYSEAHDVGHYYYHLDDPNHERHDPTLTAAVKEPLRECYRRIDRGVARLLEAAGDDAQIFTYGGPGMEMLISANDVMDEMMRRIDLGVEAPKSGTETVRQSYRNWIPQKLRWKLSPLARALRRRVANNDYAKRRFFAIPHNDNSGAVRINVKGREKHGIVERGAEYDAIVREITEAVATFKNPDTGQPLVKRVVCVPHEYSGPHLEVLPDVFIEWERAGATRNFRKVVSDVYGEIEIKDVIRSGDHNATGFYWTPTSYDGPPVTLPEHVTAPLMAAARSDRPSAIACTRETADAG